MSSAVKIADKGVPTLETGRPLHERHNWEGAISPPGASSEIPVFSLRSSQDTVKSMVVKAERRLRVRYGLRRFRGQSYHDVLKLRNRVEYKVNYSNWGKL